MSYYQAMATVTEPQLPKDPENLLPGFEYKTLSPDSKCMRDKKKVKRYENMQNSYAKQKVLLVPQA